MRLKSVQEYFTWYVSNKHFQLCDICLSNQTEILYRYNLEPSFIVLEFAPESDYLEFNQEIVNIETRSKFQLVATINQPIVNHFNCGIYDPQTEGKKFHIKGWTLHDGLENAGSLIKLANLNQLWKQRPFVLFYEKV